MSTEHKEGHFKYFIVVVLGAVAFMAVIGALVMRSAETPAPQASTDDNAVEERIKPVAEVNVGQAQAAAPAKVAASSGDPGETVFKSVCIACHGPGIAGAPKFGDQKAWADRVTKDPQTLYDHALQGFTGSKGTMPAKGGNPALADDDVRAAVRYMVNHSGGDIQAGATAPESAPATGSASTAAADGKAVFDKLCTLCHTPGVAGAPKFGDKAAWAPRIAQGLDTLHDHAIHGFAGKTGVMPPKGGGGDLSDDQVRAAVDYMVSNSK